MQAHRANAHKDFGWQIFTDAVIAALGSLPQPIAFLLWGAQAQKKAVKTVTFNVGMHCQNCVKKVKENISFEKGVKALEVNLEKKTVTITYDPAKTNEAALKKAVEKLGYTCSLEDAK